MRAHHKTSAASLFLPSYHGPQREGRSINQLNNMRCSILMIFLCVGVIIHGASGEMHLPQNTLLFQRKRSLDGRGALMSQQQRRRRQFNQNNLVPFRRCTTAAAVFPSQKQSANNNNDNDVKLWPPWPFNLFSQKSNSSPSSSEDDTTKRNAAQERRRRIKTNAALIYSYVKHGLHVGMVQVRQVGSAVTVHLPPSAPPILLLALAPSSTTSPITTTATTAVQEAVEKRTAPLFFTNPSVQKLTLTTIGLAILSWAHSETRKINRLTPLPILLDGSSTRTTGSSNNVNGGQKSSLWKQRDELRKAVLPPFLPEEVTSPPLTKPPPRPPAAATDDEETEQKNGTSPMDLYQEWRYERRLNKYRADVSRRTNMYNELMALRDLKLEREEEAKKKDSLSSSCTKSRRKLWKRGAAAADNDDKTTTNSVEETEAAAATTTKKPPMGYALVTGASRGIGRAIAIELARWNIPLILLARDTTQLSKLASDIETCYNVPCHILSADLSSNGINEAKRIHQATTKAKLRVDILINNAGICHYGDMVDMTPNEINSLLNVNAASVATLSQLYGNDMKKRKRGRIMMISSIMGILPSGPGVSLYAATKSFQRSLATSMGRELEKHGVGVTSVCPGAVQTSDFRAGTKDALCWKLPFYVMKPETIAHRSVSAMLLGDTELLPGWHNRGFVKGVIPLLPLRLSTMAVEFFWSPWSADIKLPFVWDNDKKGWRNKISFAKNKVGQNEEELMMKKYKEEDLSKYIYPMDKKTDSSTTSSSKRRSSFWGGRSSSNSNTLAEENLPPRILNLPAEGNGEEMTTSDNETSQKGNEASSQSSLKIQPLTRDRNDPTHEKQTAILEEIDGEDEQKEEKETVSDISSKEKSSKDESEKVDANTFDAEAGDLKDIEERHKEIETKEELKVDDAEPEAPDDDNGIKDNVVLEEQSDELGVEANELVPRTEKSLAKQDVDDKSAGKVDMLGGMAEEEIETNEPILDGFETVVEKLDKDQNIIEDSEKHAKDLYKTDEDMEKPALNNSSFLLLELVE